MTTFERIKKSIIEDPMNSRFTEKGIPPLFKGSKEAEIVIVGQAPGRQAELTNLFWNDKSGDRLREWMGVSRDTFYSTNKIAHLPMDFYYPGKAKVGDNSPRKEFASKWHPVLLEAMPNVRTIFVIGAYAQNYYLRSSRERNLTETVKHYDNYLPDYFPLVHPSPLNFRWHKQNPWFEESVVPVFRALIQEVLYD